MLCVPLAAVKLPAKPTLLPWRFLPTEGEPGCPGLEVAEVVAGNPEVEEGACCWDTFCSSAASCLGSTPGDLGGLLPKGAVVHTQKHQGSQGQICSGQSLVPVEVVGGCSTPFKTHIGGVGSSCLTC